MPRSFGEIEEVQPTLPWLNIWTMYDFVSFRTQEFWPPAQDVEIPIDVGFPDSHGAPTRIQGRRTSARSPKER